MNNYYNFDHVWINFVLYYVLLLDFKPPIFWKDKEIVRQQFKHWSLESIENLIFFINDIELILKKNNINSVNLLNDFILSQVKVSN